MLQKMTFLTLFTAMMVPTSGFLQPNRSFRFGVVARSGINERWNRTPLEAMSDPSEAQITPSPEENGQQLPSDDLGNIQIPSTGVSVTDEMEEVQKDKFVSELVPIGGLRGVAQVVTTATGGDIEPVRYLVALSPPDPPSSLDGTTEKTTKQTFAMTDVPPFSEQLAAKMRAFMGEGAVLTAILITSRDAIHYDEAPAVFTTRKNDLSMWKSAFPDVAIIGYRLDIPRDCRDHISQQLDGYGPWALEENSGNVTFVETGRPLTYEEWDDEVTENVMDKGQTPPDDADEISDDHLYTPDAIREREAGKRILVLYTPGHTFGSLSYIFPETGVCCSGFTIPLEDDRRGEGVGVSGAGPALDYRGYITTSRAGVGRMMESARHIVNHYSDRFSVVLPARGDPLFVDNGEEERKDSLLDIIEQYDKIGKIYEELGITSSKEDFY